MRKNPFILLVCLLFIAGHGQPSSAAPGSIKIIIDNNPSMTSGRTGIIPVQASAGESVDLAGALRPASAPPLLGPPLGLGPSIAKPIVKCKATVCDVQPMCLYEPGVPCFLPHRSCGQWELSVQAFFARIRGTVTCPYLPTVDFNDNLGLDCHKALFEYSARFQFRPHWVIMYSIMPIDMEANYCRPLLPGLVFKSKWQSIYQRVGLIYEPLRTCSGAISLSAGWVLYDQKLAMDNGGAGCGLAGAATCTTQRTRNMVMTGIEFQKCIRTMCNGGSLSCDNRAGIAWLDGSLGIDVQTGLQYSVPLNCGRYGYAKGGYRLIDFKEDRYDCKIDTYLCGWFAEMGLVF